MKQKELQEIKDLLTGFAQKYEGKLSLLEKRVEDLGAPKQKVESRVVKLPPQAKKVQFIIRTETNEWVFNLLV